MNPTRKGLGNRVKVAIVVILVIAGLGLGFLAPSLLSGIGSKQPSAQSQSDSGVSTYVATSLNPTPGSNVTGVYSLIGLFPKMQISVAFYDEGDGIIENESLAYSVLGTASLNSSQYTKVDFTTAGTGDGNEVVAWFNSSGDINRVDVIGQKNFTGPGAYVLASSYTAAFGTIPTITNNATLMALLSKTTETTTSIGPTQVNLTTYNLAAPTATYKSITAQYASLVSTGLKLAVYLDEDETDGSTTLIQVTSISQ